MAGEFLDPRLWPLWMKSQAIDLPMERSWPQDLYTSQVRKIQQDNPPPWEGRSEDRPTTGLLDGIAVRGELMRPPIKTPWQQIYPLVNHIFPTDNIQSLVRGDPEPPMANLPNIPQKVPSTRDPRYDRGIFEAFKIGANLMPFANLAVSPPENLQSLLRGDPEPTQYVPNFPDVPGKVPQVPSDPRLGGAALEIAGLAANTLPPGVPRSPMGAASRMAGAKPTGPRGMYLNTPHEQIPGEGTGIAPNLLDKPFEERGWWANLARWMDKDKLDKLLRDANVDQREVAEGVGRWVPENGQPANNPVDVSQHWVRLKDGTTEIVEPDRKLAQANNTARAAVDAQNIVASSAMHSPGWLAGGTSLDINLGRMVTPKQLELIAKFADQHNLVIANSPHGVSLLNTEGNIKNATSAYLLGRRLQNALRQEVPNAKVTQAHFHSIMADITDELSAVNSGTGGVTRKLLHAVDELEKVDPEAAQRLIHSEAIKEKAARNAARAKNHSYGTDRDDYTKVLWPILAEGSIDALMKYVAKNGYKGLPAIAPFMLPSGNGNSGTDG